MAERLESGQIQIRPVNAAPMQQVQAQQVDYGIAAREQARYANTMADLLDRMGKTINVQAKEMRTQEAIRYAAQYPPTLEQIKMAKEGMPAAVPGLGRSSGEFGYFGQALKKARTLQVSSAFEMEGMNELTKLLADVEGGRIKADQVQEKISSISKGYTTALTKIDPEAAIKFNATMATHGNTVLKAALEADAKHNKAVSVIKVRENFNNVKRLLEATVSQGEYIDPATGEKYSIDVLSDTLRANLQTQTLSLGDAALSKEIMDGFEKELRDAKIGAVTRYILSNDLLLNDPANLRGKIMTAQLDKMSPVMLGLLQTDMSAVAQINANVDIALNRRESETKARQAEQKLNASQNVTALATEGFGLPETNTKRRKEIGQALSEIRRLHPDIVPLDLIKEMVEPVEKKEGNSQVEFNVRAMIFEGKITKADQIWAYTKKGLSIKQAVSALSLLYREDKQDQSKLERGIAERSDIPTGPGGSSMLDPKGAEFERSQRLKAKAEEIKERNKREGKPPPTPEQILKEIDKDIATQRETEKAKAARKQLDDIWSKQPWINGPINRGNLPALKEKAKKENKMREYEQIEKLVNQAEGR